MKVNGILKTGIQLEKLNTGQALNLTNSDTGRIFYTNTGKLMIWDGESFSLLEPLKILVINLETNYTLETKDIYRTLIRFSGDVDRTVTIPFTDSVSFPIGTCILVSNNTQANALFISAAAGVIINTPTTLKIAKRHGKVTIIKVAENEWDIEGNLEPD